MRNWQHLCLNGTIVVFATLGFFQSAAAQDRVWHFGTEQFPPYSFERSGLAAGPMVDILQAVCAKLQIRCSAQVLPWRRALLTAERGQADGVFTIVDTPERRAAFYVAHPVVEAKYTFYALSANPWTYARPGDLGHLSIGVYGPSATSTRLAELAKGIDAHAVLETDNGVVLRKLRAGRYGADGVVLVNERVAEAIIQHDGLTGIRQAGEAARFAYTFGLSRQRVSEADFARFNQALEDLCRTGRLQVILNAYRMQASACRKSG